MAQMTPTKAEFVANIKRIAARRREQGLIEHGTYVPLTPPQKQRKAPQDYVIKSKERREQDAREHSPSLTLLEEFSAPDDL